MTQRLCVGSSDTAFQLDMGNGLLLPVQEGDLIVLSPDSPLKQLVLVNKHNDAKVAVSAFSLKPQLLKLPLLTLLNGLNFLMLKFVSLALNHIHASIVQIR